MLLKVEKRCQTTIEKILKSIVDERRNPNLVAERIYIAALLLSQVWLGNYGLPRRSRWGENGKGMRLASFIDGRIGSAGCQAAQPRCVFRGSL